MSNDYQNQMKGRTLDADVAGNDAAASVTGITSQGGLTHNPKGHWGLLPAGHIPLDFAIGRQSFFRDEIERTLIKGPDKPFMDDDKIKNSLALQSQQEMLNNYTSDITQLPGADQAYNMFAPLASIAAKSVAKTEQVGKSLGYGAGLAIGSALDANHAGALKKAVVSEKMQASDSVAGHSSDMSSKRQLMVGAADALAITMNQGVIRNLNKEVAESAEKKKKIEEKIEKVERWCGYIETGVGLVAGGAGALGGAGAAAAAEAESVGSTTMETVKGVAEKGEKGASILGKIATFGMKLYYEDEFRKLDAVITRANGEITGWDAANQALDLEGKHATFKGAAGQYAQSVDNYQKAIDDRRMHMASAGAAADVNAHVKGDGQTNSTVMLWMEALLESQSMLRTATDAGGSAKEKLRSVLGSVGEHRNHKWANIEDIWGQNSMQGTRSEKIGNDVHALATMARVTDTWLEGSAMLAGVIDNAVGKAGDGKDDVADTLGKAGFSSDF